MNNFEKRVAAQMEKLESTLEQKILGISPVVVNKVTNRLTRVMEKMIPRPRNEEDDPEGKDLDKLITQESPTPLSKSSPKHNTQQNIRIPKEANPDSTAQMLIELQEIESTDLKSIAPQHDNKPPGVEQHPS